MNNKKILEKILSGSKSIKFSDFTKLVTGFGFKLDRIKGSHHIYKMDGIEELINLQNVNNEIKPYQIKQFLAIIEKYNLELGDN
ncbi:MAG TPA: type II toxin-antitoxin system HicA family toxin [Candidatus Kapabacteria bacterium]|nr:type II toxin-antitoxin system HicA family toxin [Candidatus Kapabacteria bacterium]HPO62208.1 type II toxin-antitoxin system HicA family toxin [Candidatus Kapabacteria bacterium]